MKSKEQKRIEAEVRQEEYDALSVEEKWDRVRPFRSTRQRNRLGMLAQWEEKFLEAL